MTDPKRAPESVDMLRGITDTRARVMRVAIELFYEQGYGGTGLREIADLAAVNVASIYHHFRSKEDILVAIIEVTYGATFHPSERLVAEAAGPAEALVELTRHHIAYHCEHAAAAAVSDRELGSLKIRARTRALVLRDSYERVWDGVLRAGQDQGLFRIDDVELVRIAILSMCSQVATWYRPGGRVGVSDIADLYARLVLRVVGYRRRPAA